MNCNIVKDLIPLYIDECCSEESQNIIKEHLENCEDCKKVFNDMSSDCHTVSEPVKIIKLNRINERRASVLQSVLLFVSFALIAIGVALEAKTPLGLMNGFWAINLVIPATGFMLSLSNWYFVRLYKNRKRFSNYSLIATLVITLCGYIWAGFHYEMPINVLFESFHAWLVLGGGGIFLTILFCALSKSFSNKYSIMLGKE